DQWFPETARCLALLGAEVLLFPTAIGSEPGAAQLDSRDHWQIAQRGQAAANLVPLVAANRIGREVACGDPALA
ncbi:nitrilase-related carbon-nitrogen hydrolase, partial [Escherichia coli]|nr:nitrilase-related carbon-nitrogen hydrolase [Escherichia coli]